MNQAADAGRATPAHRVLAGAPALQEWQEDLYRDLHRHPELSHRETRTATTAATVLRAAGFEVHEGIGTTGVVGVLRNGDGPTVLVRADMDALPMAEATGLEYTSVETVTDADGSSVPVAHACGHDVHVACLAGAARLLAGAQDAWHGTFIALFQPAEEVAGGAKAMLEGGLADLIPHPDVAFAQHVLAFPSGTVATAPGPVLTSADNVRITVYGRGGHGSMPHLTVDPVVLAAMIVVRLQTVVSREVPPSETAVLTIGRIAAGTKSNIIPDHAVIDLNLRTYNPGTRDTLVAALQRIVRAECEASGSPRPPLFEYSDHYPVTVNAAEPTARVAAGFARHFGESAVAFDQQTASEDFSEIPDALGTPYSYWGLGGSDPDAYAKAEASGSVATDIPSNHSPRFAPVIQPTLTMGTAAIVVAAMEWLG